MDWGHLNTTPTIPIPYIPSCVPCNPRQFIFALMPKHNHLNHLVARLITLYYKNAVLYLLDLDVTHEGRYITTSQKDQIWTVVFNPSGAETPVLMIHGLGAGLGIWVMNIKELSENRPVYTFDLLGFGRSSRPDFDEDPQTVEETFINSIADTIKELGLEKCILIGHSFGAYLAYAYAIKHPERVKSLILVDPWGFTEKTQDWEQNEAVPKWIKMMAAMLSPFNPYAALRFVGPLGNYA